MRSAFRSFVRRHDDTLAGLLAVGLVLVASGLLLIGCWSLGALILRWAWGLVMPALFHLPPLSFPQALGIVLLLGFVRSLLSVTVKPQA